MIIDPDDKIAEKRQPDEAGNVAISQALAAGDRGQRRRPGGNEFLEPPMGPCDRLEQRLCRTQVPCIISTLCLSDLKNSECFLQSFLAVVCGLLITEQGCPLRAAWI